MVRSHPWYVQRYKNFTLTIQGCQLIICSGLLMFGHQGGYCSHGSQGLDTVHASSRLRHCPPGAGFAGMQKTKVSYRVLEASTEISKKSLRVQSVCGIFGVPASSTDRMMHETVKLKVKLQWRPQEVTDDRIWSDC